MVRQQSTGNTALVLPVREHPAVMLVRAFMLEEESIPLRLSQVPKSNRVLQYTSSSYFPAPHTSQIRVICTGFAPIYYKRV